MPGAGGVPGAGFGTTNLACAFQATSYIDVPGASLQLSGALTLMAWAKSPPVSGPTQSIASLGTNGCRLTMDASGHPHFSDGVQSFGDLVATNQINDNQWHQLAGIYDGTNVESLYVDGRLAAESTNATAFPLMTGEDFWIGGDPDFGAFQFFNGVVDEVAIFTNALTANQLLLLFSTASHGALLSPPGYASGTGLVSLTWSAVPGLTYEIQSTTNLSQPNWTVLSSNLTATNSTIAISLSAGSGRQHFYRVLVLP
jgi:hypothetical protein